ncbi:4'-phosphopantetheinyl transferase family protein [Mucilaginibacter paludis]|uniref:4'-phosphopantetheinyl transferase n=1 Tax=Mucilaginibacter paludis DSM 18603 TaxID=714943 RepID=H1YG88_9SPHI|nr:4'-phosphopantetheinyl transferase superfamily protein [Mucilaginibacter paludis]EHQ27352.1 4'-phosphopantetheinyl transferase [Mucilaginibacter paludis DSM 18603]
MDKPVIQVNHLENICWNNPVSDLKVHQSTDVWRLRVSSYLEDIADLWLILHPAEQQRANRYRREQDKQRFIIAHAYLRILLGKYMCISPKDILLETGDNGKPIMKSVEEKVLHFNISHSGDYVLIAISDSETGVDVEKTNKEMHFDEVMDISFSKAEIAFVKTSGNPTLSFYRLWTRKEALLKATAQGIDDHLKFIPALNGSHNVSNDIMASPKNWQVSSFVVDKDYTAAVAYNNSNVNFNEILTL